MLVLVGLGFLVTLRSINVFVFDWLGNRTCIITIRLSDFKSQTSLTLLRRHYELSNENVSYFLTNQSKTKTFIDLIVTSN